MSMNTTPKGERIHIALFGRRNAGKSSLINAITGQDLAIVSDVLGTTTDPVYKAMEILPLGPVMLIDTPGLDDEGVLGEERIAVIHFYQFFNKFLHFLICHNVLKKIADNNVPIHIHPSRRFGIYKLQRLIAKT